MKCSSEVGTDPSWSIFIDRGCRGQKLWLILLQYEGNLMNLMRQMVHQCQVQKYANVPGIKEEIPNTRLHCLNFVIMTQEFHVADLILGQKQESEDPNDIS